MTAVPRTSDSLAQCITRLVASAPPEELMPMLAPFDEWAVSLETAHLLDGLIQHLRPSSILEFGAGRSSLVLASALQRCGGGRFTSLEHQPAYAEQAWRKMSQLRTFLGTVHDRVLERQRRRDGAGLPT